MKETIKITGAGQEIVLALDDNTYRILSEVAKWLKSVPFGDLKINKKEDVVTIVASESKIIIKKK